MFVTEQLFLVIISIINGKQNGGISRVLKQHPAPCLMRSTRQPSRLYKGIPWKVFCTVIDKTGVAM